MRSAEKVFVLASAFLLMVALGVFLITTRIILENLGRNRFSAYIDSIEAQIVTMQVNMKDPLLISVVKSSDDWVPGNTEDKSMCLRADKIMAEARGSEFNIFIITTSFDYISLISGYGKPILAIVDKKNIRDVNMSPGHDKKVGVSAANKNPYNARFVSSEWMVCQNSLINLPSYQ